MATYYLGRVLPVFKGTYSNTTTYQPLDIVYYNGSSYVAKQTSTGHVPPSAPAYWQIMALKGELSPTLSPEQVDSIIAQITAETSWVNDPDYVHTDNNLTNEQVEAINNIGQGNLTIQRNGVTAATFSANSNTNVSVDINVPTNIQDLSGWDAYVTKPSVQITTGGMMKIAEIKPNVVYYGEMIDELDINIPEAQDVKQLYEAMPTYIHFTTVEGFNFKNVDTFKWAGEVPEWKANAEYRIKIWGGVLEGAEIK